jgi:hypothetical protein
MKIVINKCYGGFGLSPLGIKRYAELIGKECYFFKVDYKKSFSNYIPITLEEAQKQRLFFNAFTVPNPSEVLGTGDWYNKTQEERIAHNELYSSIELANRDIKRNDPNLIKVVEELGEKADGDCSELAIVEIPDDVDWYIEEYDGNEHVAEKHRTWY